ncbi:MAG: TetR/AcrR family transcriptional regulator [Psychrilyobacter sp.]|uniref:TetR/AcrR family transcriptional regulator n=1 Tax=Psychrilyobacter sp. TaxID=2586924 RepID=UPI003C75DC95
MPKKPIFTREEIIDKAFSMLERGSLENITARSLAKELNCSPAPIYGLFMSMDELKKELINRAKNLFLTYVSKEKEELPFLNIGLGICKFSREEKPLFKSIFLRNSSYSTLISEFHKIIFDSIQKDGRFSGLPTAVKETLTIDCWISAHGLSTLIATGYFKNPSDDFIRERLISGPASIIYFHLGIEKEKQLKN